MKERKKRRESVTEIGKKGRREGEGGRRERKKYIRGRVYEQREESEAGIIAHVY